MKHVEVLWCKKKSCKLLSFMQTTTTTSILCSVFMICWCVDFKQKKDTENVEGLGCLYKTCLLVVKV